MDFFFSFFSALYVCHVSVNANDALVFDHFYYLSLLSLNENTWGSTVLCMCGYFVLIEQRRNKKNFRLNGSSTPKKIEIILIFDSRMHQRGSKREKHNIKIIQFWSFTFSPGASCSIFIGFSVSSFLLCFWQLPQIMIGFKSFFSIMIDWLRSIKVIYNTNR